MKKSLLILLSFPLCLGGITSLSAMNPILPGTAFVPDGEPHVFDFGGEKRVFLYGSRDEQVTGYCGDGHDGWSAPVTDLSKWRNHGEIFNVRQVQDIGYGRVPRQMIFGAPDCVYNPVTKKYYLYTFFGGGYNQDGIQGPAPGTPGFIAGWGSRGPGTLVAESTSPAGPFTNPVMCDWHGVNGTTAFDPGVLVDQQKDGSVRVFAYCGAKSGDWWAEIDPTDMHTIIDGKTRKPDREAMHKTLLPPEQNHNSTLFEASSIKKVDEGKYVFIYSANELKSGLTYCYGDSPEGPWTYGGPIINNRNHWNSSNNHGSIAKVGDHWYVFYHRGTSDDFNRQAMVEPIDLRIDGGKVVIPQVEMTSQGAETNGLPAFRRYNAGVACYLAGKAFVDGKQRCQDGLNPIVGLGVTNTEIGYKYLNFGETPVTDADHLQLRMNLRRVGTGTLSVQVSEPADANTPAKRVEIATLLIDTNIPADGAFHEVVVPVSLISTNQPLQAIGGLHGKRALFLNVPRSGSEVCQLKEIEFAKGETPTPNSLRDVKIPSFGGGSVVARPCRARVGESVKLSVLPTPWCVFVSDSLQVKDAKGNNVTLHENGAAPYAPKSYSFEMPDSEVTLSASFKSKN